MTNKYSENKPTLAYSYLRVSTEMQIDGYSLDAQREIIKDYCERNNMEIVKEFCDAGISGASAEGRPQFMEMLDNIQKGIDDVKFVIVYKLSRFGRNTADTLASVQKMQDYGVNLIAVEEKIDTSSATGKLMCTMLATFAELDRSNIKEQTLRGRIQKARSGLWNGGIPPYGYKVVDNKLAINEDEAEVVRNVFRLYTTTVKGVTGITKWLNNSDFEKKLNKHRSSKLFNADFVKKVLVNPVYCGDIVYRRTTNQPVPGKRGRTRRVRAEHNDWVVARDSHPALVDRETFEKAQIKVSMFKESYMIPKRDEEHVHLLASLLKCPVCGSSLYGNSHQQKKADGSYYKREYYYRCLGTHNKSGSKCSFKRQFSQKKLNAVVESLIVKLVDRPEFATLIQAKIGAKVDVSVAESELQHAIVLLDKEKRILEALENEIDQLDPSDELDAAKRERLNNRLQKLYDRVAEAERNRQEKQVLLENIKGQTITLENIYAQLKNFRVLYDKFTEREQSVLMHTLIKRIDLNPDSSRDPRTFIKEVHFQFPIVQCQDGTLTNLWKNDATVENVALVVKA